MTGEETQDVQIQTRIQLANSQAGIALDTFGQKYNNCHYINRLYRGLSI